ncbi:MAG: hypothetical protein FWG47_04630 [Propionibacteriaceae bacterium]|nr:hypothetical protein [Propionibacteriaceae bacterium]
MRAVCVCNDPKVFADNYHGMFDFFHDLYPLTVGSRYLILGMTIFRNQFFFLVKNDFGSPDFAPSAFFEFFVADVPDSWKFRSGRDHDVSEIDSSTELPCAKWGYPELVDDSNHGSDLEAREIDALMIFEARYQAAFHEDVKSSLLTLLEKVGSLISSEDAESLTMCVSANECSLALELLTTKLYNSKAYIHPEIVDSIRDLTITLRMDSFLADRLILNSAD